MKDKTTVISLFCPDCGGVMKPMKTKDKYKCPKCKLRAQQLTIFNLEQSTRAIK